MKKGKKIGVPLQKHTKTRNQNTFCAWYFVFPCNLNQAETGETVDE